MESCKLVSAQVKLPQLWDSTKTLEQLIWIHENAIAAEVVGREIELCQLVQVVEAARQRAEIVGSDF